MKKSDKSIILMLIGILLAAAAYFFVYKNLTAETEVMQKANAELEQEVNDMPVEGAEELGMEEMSDEDNASIGGLSGAADIGMPEDDMSDESSSEDVLPSGDDLGVDLSDSAE